MHLSWFIAILILKGNASKTLTTSLLEPEFAQIKLKINILSDKILNACKSEMKEVYNSRHIWSLFDQFIRDIDIILSAEPIDFRDQLIDFINGEMAKVVKEFLASKFWDPTTISGDALNEDIFRRLSIAYVQYCVRMEYNHKNQPVIASMLRDVEQKLKVNPIQNDSQ